MEWNSCSLLVTQFNSFFLIIFFFNNFTIELMKTHNISLLAKYQIDKRLVIIFYIKCSNFLKLYRKQELIYQININIVIDSLNIIKDNHLLYYVH